MAQSDDNSTNPNNGLDPAQDSSKAVTVEGVLLQRQRGRRIDLRSSAGVLRESARIYKEMRSGRLSLAAADIASRVLRRHSEMLSAEEQRRQLAELQRDVAALRSAPLGGRPSIAPMPAWATDAGERDS